MRRLVNLKSGMAPLGALLVVLLAGCSKSPSGTYIDVTVLAEAGLALDGESLTAKAMGKADLVQTLPFLTSQHLTLVPSDLADGALVTLEARGLKGMNDGSGVAVVLDRARVKIAIGQRVSVNLSLTAVCAGVLSCTSDQTCRGGTCTTITTVTGTDGGTSDGGKDAVDGPDGSAGAGGAGAGGSAGGSAGSAGSGGSVGGAGAGGSVGGAGSGGMGICTNGSIQSCSAPPFNKKGACGLDNATCVSGAWAGCVDTKGADTCDAGNDNNCNGMANEGCPCVNGNTQDCGHATVGICKLGKSTCTSNAWGACVGNVEPAARDCSSSMDNDCDGKPDNVTDTVCKCPVGGAAQTCGAHPGNDGKGMCKAGSQACVLAANKATSDWGACTGSVGPAGADTCDAGNDNNCNGMANENCPCVNGNTQDCGHATVGICKVGKSTCTNSAWGGCVGNVEPAARDCSSSLDNDCDGRPDNTTDTVCKCPVGGAPQACGTHPGNDGKGICKAGSQSCVLATNKATSDWGTCTGSVGPAAADTCGATSDENCNGTFHDGCACVNGQPAPCTCGSPTTCTNGVKGTCATVPITQYVDGDGDGYGKAGTASQQCPGAAGFSQNANDCDDANASFKPGVSVCVSPNTSDQLRTCLPSGTIMTSSCSDGCFNGKCRSDGTIGLPGWVSCTTANTPRCPAAQGCNLDTGACGLPADMLHYVKCDGQNDCPAGQTCCGFAVRGSNTVDCYAGGCPDGSHREACDPLAPTNCVEPSIICNTIATPSNAMVCQ